MKLRRKKRKTKVKKVIKSLSDPRRMIIFILCVAILSVSIFLIASRPTDIDKINMDYGEVLDVELLKSNATAKFKDTYELKDYTIYGEN